MTTTHPLITRYYDAERAGDIDALVALFAPDAEVLDEGTTWQGPEGVRAWREHASSSYTWTTTITDVEEDGDWTVVSVHLEGDFPGGTADLRQRFRLADDQIRRLDIRP